jgi:hypothetical protein
VSSILAATEITDPAARSAFLALVSPVPRDGVKQFGLHRGKDSAAKFAREGPR